jgi:hypothetical protein
MTICYGIIITDSQSSLGYLVDNVAVDHKVPMNKAAATLTETHCLQKNKERIR